MERMSNQAPPPWEKNAKPINSLPKKEFDTTGNNEESKENIRPTINNNDEYDKNHINEYSAITLEDAKDINVFHEIEECIKLFCKFHSNHDWKTSKINSDDTDFLGWDGI